LVRVAGARADLHRWHRNHITRPAHRHDPFSPIEGDISKSQALQVVGGFFLAALGYLFGSVSGGKRDWDTPLVEACRPSQIGINTHIPERMVEWRCVMPFRNGPFKAVRQNKRAQRWRGAIRRLLHGLRAGDLESLHLTVAIAADENRLPSGDARETARILTFLKRLVRHDAALPRRRKTGSGAG
jgi:hypothetical protein